MIKDLREENGIWIDRDEFGFKSKSEYVFTKLLPSCGCGNPRSISRSIAEYVLGMLKTYTPKAGEDPLIAAQYEDLPVMFFLSWADREGYIEHGTTIRCSWLTKKGEELIIDIEYALEEDNKINGEKWATGQ